MVETHHSFETKYNKNLKNMKEYYLDLYQTAAICTPKKRRD
jgi:hypothetical protein